MVFWNNSINFKHFQIYTKEEKRKKLHQLEFIMNSLNMYN